MKRKLTREELESAFDEQWGFLQRSCAAFDAGERGEAKRIASTLRVLLHDTKNSRSLLAQLGLKDILFFDTSENVSADNLLPTFGLVVIHLSPRGARYVPPLAQPLNHPVWMVAFEHWWKKTVIRIPNEFDLSRANLVLTMADQDGGAHIDPSIDERYYRLTRENAMGFVVSTEAGTVPLVDIEGASVRQIAQEVLVSLVEARRMIPPDLPETVPPPRRVFVQNAETGLVKEREVPYRNMCPCNSGLEYRQCHARGAPNEGRTVDPRAT